MRTSIVVVAALGCLLSVPAAAQDYQRIWMVKAIEAEHACVLTAQRDAAGSPNVDDVFYWQVRRLAELQTGFSFSAVEAERLRLPPAGSSMSIDITVTDRSGGHILRNQSFHMVQSEVGPLVVTGVLPIDTLSMLERGRKLRVSYEGRIIYTLDLTDSAEDVRAMGPCMADIGRGLEGRVNPAAPPPAAALPAAIEALQGKMPPSFDLAVEDPCTGTWAIKDPRGTLHLSVIRYKDTPIVHLRADDGQQKNVLAQPLGPDTVRFAAAGATYTMRCSAAVPVVEREMMVAGSPSRLKVNATEDTP